jgi:holo-[acyl-carrier protein] synthase
VIIGIGVDVVDLNRFRETLQRTPSVRDRILTANEADLPLESMAARFAAKEALAKALGAPGELSWHDAEVTSDGPPRFLLRGTVQQRADELGVRNCHLSLSHDAGVSVAMVVLES